MKLEVEYFSAGHLKVSDLFNEMRPFLDDLYRRFIHVNDVVLTLDDENFWTARVYYFDNENH